MESVCVLDSCGRGSYIGEAIQELAASLGWKGEFSDHDDEFYCEAWDEALQFLYQIPAGEDGAVYFEHEDGSLMFGDAQAYYDEADVA